MGMNPGFMMPNTGAAYMDPSMINARMQNQPYGGGMGYNNQLGFNSQAGYAINCDTFTFATPLEIWLLY